MKHLLNKKRNNGLTLVEVVVACGILAMVLAGTITLILTVVNLSLSARQKTEAVTMAQKVLTDCVVAYRAEPGTFDTVAGQTCPASVTLSPGSDLTGASGTIQDVSVPNSTVNFAQVTATITWQIRGDPNPSTYSLTQIIRKDIP